MISADVQQLAPGALVTLFVLDLSMLGGPVYRFHPGTNELRQPITWQGQVYEPRPMEATGFERSGRGTLPRPTVRAANVAGLLSALALQYDDLIGAKLVRRRTFAKYLDAVNFPGGVNPTADPNAAFADEVWYVERKAEESKLRIEWELSAAWDVDGVQLPRRQIIANTCPWVYRGPECGYTGPAVADLNDIPTEDPTLDQCGKRVASCKLRFGPQGPLPFGGFPAAGLLRT